MKLSEKINGIKEFVLDLIFPKICLVCSREGSYLCPTCLEKLPLISHFHCLVCQKISAFGKTCENCQNKTALNGIIYAVDYKNPIIAEAIKSLKYHYVKGLINPLAQLLIKMIKNSYFLVNNFSDDLSSFIVLPIPLHRRKYLYRGFNQSELLAQKIAEEFDLRLEKNVLIKIKNTHSQTNLNKKERKINIKKSFGVKNKELVKDKIIFLIDDVLTTGATLNEAAAELKKAGTQEVWGITLARE